MSLGPVSLLRCLNSTTAVAFVRNFFLPYLLGKRFLIGSQLLRMQAGISLLPESAHANAPLPLPHTFSGAILETFDRPGPGTGTLIMLVQARVANLGDASLQRVGNFLSRSTAGNFTNGCFIPYYYLGFVTSSLVIRSAHQPTLLRTS